MELSENRKTALALVLAIIAAEMALSGRWGNVWKALWGPAFGLGTGALSGGARQTLPPGYHWQQINGGIWFPVPDNPGGNSGQTGGNVIANAPTTNQNGGGSGSGGGVQTF